MAKIFDRVVKFHVQGEIYGDDHVDPDSVINNYTWTQKDVEGEIHIIGRHKDSRGRINKMVKLSKVSPWLRPKGELFLKL